MKKSIKNDQVKPMKTGIQSEAMEVAAKWRGSKRSAESFCEKHIKYANAIKRIALKNLQGEELKVASWIRKIH